MSSWAASLPFYYGWVIVGAVFLRTFTTAGAMWTTGILSVPMHDDLGWSRTIIFTGAERNLLINQLDRPVFLERAEAEDAAEAARAAFEEVRFLAG